MKKPEQIPYEKLERAKKQIARLAEKKDNLNSSSWSYDRRKRKIERKIQEAEAVRDVAQMQIDRETRIAEKYAEQAPGKISISKKTNVNVKNNNVTVQAHKQGHSATVSVPSSSPQRITSSKKTNSRKRRK